MVDKKIFDYNMRDDFQFPVYVSYELADFGGGIQGILPEKRISGVFTRKGGETFLELAAQPLKPGSEKSSVRTNLDEVQSEKDSHDWYATTWSGEIQFTLRRYVKVGGTEHFGFNSVSYGATSKWNVYDFVISSQFHLNKQVYRARLDIDHMFDWFGISNPRQDADSLQKLEYHDLKFQGMHFSLNVYGGFLKKNGNRIFQNVATLDLVLMFDQPQEKEPVYQLAVQVRNLMQMLMGKKAGINRIILNQDQSRSGDKLLPKDERENWFLAQSFLPENVNESDRDWSVPFLNIKENFPLILESFFKNQKIQKLVSSFLLISQYKVPISTAVITLVSSIETFYNEEKYENGKKIRNAKDKLKKFLNLIQSPSDLVRRELGVSDFNIDAMISRIKNSRDYFVHGEKENEFTSETDLITDLMALELLVKHVIILIITNSELFD